jgi:hypothetical protein
MNKNMNDLSVSMIEKAIDTTLVIDHTINLDSTQQNIK